MGGGEGEGGRRDGNEVSGGGRRQVRGGPGVGSGVCSGVGSGVGSGFVREERQEGLDEGDPRRVVGAIVEPLQEATAECGEPEKVQEDGGEGLAETDESTDGVGGGIGRREIGVVHGGQLVDGTAK